ncbi:prepilin-type N-terminal cleavage/methylation domain-containing protein [bacterium]|nr:prepilin-type N-terminal cleavage/methylation domain-containing protein [bacterium]
MVNREKNAGFTLVELMICVACIGILASIVIPEIEGYRIKARNAMVVSNLRNVISAQEVYYADHYRYSAYQSQNPAYQDLLNYGLNTNADVLLYSSGSAGGADPISGLSLPEDAFVAVGAHDKMRANFPPQCDQYKGYLYMSDQGYMLANPAGQYGAHCDELLVTVFAW